LVKSSHSHYDKRQCGSMLSLNFQATGLKGAARSFKARQSWVAEAHK